MRADCAELQTHRPPEGVLWRDGRRCRFVAGGRPQFENDRREESGWRLSHGLGSGQGCGFQEDILLRRFRAAGSASSRAFRSLTRTHLLHVAQPKKFSDPLICLLNVELELKSEKDNAEVRIKDVAVRPTPSARRPGIAAAARTIFTRCCGRAGLPSFRGR